MIRTVTYAYTQEYIQLLGLVYAGWRRGEVFTNNHTYSILHTGLVIVRRRRPVCMTAVIMRV